MEQFEIDWLKKWAMYSPAATAIRCIDSNRVFSYKELYERANSLAKILREEKNIKSGDRVAILSMNEPELIFLFFALQRLGAILVPINFRFSSREVEHVLNDSGAKLFFYQKEFQTIIDNLKSTADYCAFEGENGLAGFLNRNPSGFIEMESSVSHPVMILYTSGTTGAPKGALITHKMLFWNSINTGLRLNITPSDSTIIFHPMFHTSGWNVLTTPFFHHGAKIILLKKFDASTVLQICDKEKISILFGVPTMMDMMAATDQFKKSNLKSLRYAIVGGEPMPVPLIEVWAKKGIPVRQGYGLTEFGPNVFSLNEEDAIRKIGSIGFPNFYIDVKVVDNEGLELKLPDQVGELCLRGPACTPGYWNNSLATAESIRDGWFHTGDLVRRDMDGYFYVVGRKKDMFISGAENVYPAEVEQYLRSHEKIHEVAVIGVKDEKWGEVGKCFYSTQNGEPISDEHLKSYSLSGLAKYKIPKSFVHMKSLPKGDSGKIQKRALL